MTDNDFFKTEIDRAVAHVAMNRPDKANSMSPAFWDELPRLLRSLEEDLSIRVVVLSGEGKHFCAGMDLASFQHIMDLFDAEPGRAAFALRELILRLQRALSAVEEARLPVIAAVHGACLGGAIDLITACDMRVSAEDAFFAIEEINIGMTADVGTLQRLPSLIPAGVARELALTGRRFTAAEARGWGLLNSVHADRDAAIDAALSMARDIAAKSPLAVAGIKKASNYARDHSVADGLDQIATWNAGMLRPADLRAALEARMKQQQAAFDDLIASGL